MFEGSATAHIRINRVGRHAAHSGSDRAALLLYGYPQTHVMWHGVAPISHAPIPVVYGCLRSKRGVACVTA